MKKICIYFVLILFVSGGYAEYPRNPHIDDATWNDLQPYFLPETMPIKPKLDKIFSKRATQSRKSLESADFKLPATIRKPNHPLVIKHPKLKGYLLKLFTDDNGFVDAHVDWKRRIIGAHYVREAIERLGYKKLFKVPHKWIYPIPHEPPVIPGSYRQNFLLVVEDMHIFKSGDNKGWWKSIAMNKELVDAIFTIFQDVGLSDSVYPDNLPFSHDRRMAFVDTQHYHKWPIHFEKLLPYFSFQMQAYWSKVIQYGGPWNIPAWEEMPEDLLSHDSD
jgi:hypothetical protein